MQTITRNTLKLTLALLLIASMFAGLAPSVAYAACSPLPANSFDLWAKTGTTTFYTGSPTVTIWGYASLSSDPAGLPGPVLVVNQGDCVGVTLHNVDIPGSTSLLFQGQSIVPDTTGVATGFDNSISPYTFTASKPGTFLYEAGLTPNGQHQVAMGMYGALVVRPSGFPSAPGQAYASASTAFDTEQVLVLSEFDNATTFASNPAAFDMRKYAPKYFLINGKAYPGTSALPVTAGDDVLLRYVNAGLTSHHMGILGLSQTVLGQDGRPFTFSHKMVSETIAPGQTLDALVTIPSAPSATQYALYDSNLLLRNNTGLTSFAGFGGMLTFLTAGPGIPPPPVDTGPSTSSLGLAPNPTGGSVPSPVTVTATITDAVSFASSISAAEFYIDSTASTAYPMSADDLAFDEPTETVTSTLPISTVLLQALASGNHTIFVRGRDSAFPTNNWGPFLSITLNLDKTGPATTGLSLTPNPSSGAVSVALTATGNDTAAGNSNVSAAEYWVDTGSPVAMTIVAGPASSTRNFTATIPSGLSQGTHIVSVRSQDSFGNWGAASTINLNVTDTVPPITSGVTALPGPNTNNGSNPFNTTVQAVRVTALFSDDASNIAAGEGFLDTIGATGTGFVFTATDGNFNSLSETGFADIPLVVINALSAGNHTIHVHGKDAAGNWGPMGTVTLLIDKTVPTFTGISLAPNPTLGANSVTMTILGASDPLVSGLASGVTGGEYWFGTTNPAPGGGTPFSGLTPSFNTNLLPDGVTTVRARVRDAAGNWSTVVQGANLTVTHLLYFSTFGNGTVTGAGAPYDDADIYLYNGSVFSRVFDANVSGTLPLPTGANVDGFDRVSATQFYLSFSADTAITGFGTVQDEDIVEYNAGTWSVYFDGTAAGLTAAAQDIDAFNISGGVLYFSTVGNTNPPGVAGAADDADVYSWNGVSFARVWDATASGFAGGANVDGLVLVDATHFYLSFSADTVVPGIGTVQDEDVVYNNNSAWFVYFNGTSKGLTAAAQDVDAFDLP